jgi:hypothetical protein
VIDSSSKAFDVVYRIVIDNASDQAVGVSLSPRQIQISYAIGSSPSAIPITINTNSIGTPSFKLAVEGLAGVTASPNTGTAPGSVNLSLNTGSLTTPGTFNGLLVLYASQTASQLDSIPITLTVTATPTITVPATADAGTTLNVTLANGPGHPRDWVALYCPATQPDGSYVTWMYLSGTTTAPGTGLTGASLAFTVPSNVASCQVRWYGHDTYTLIATSATVTVPPPASPPTITMTRAGQTLTATLDHGPANPTDWIALYCPAGNPSYVDYKYMGNTRTAPGSGLASATVTFTAPTTAANCNAVWYERNTFTILATSNTVQLPVAAPTISVSAASGIVTVTLANGPASPTDWVALYCPASAGDTSYVDYKYLNDTRSAPASGLAGATVHLTLQAAATCNVRWFASNSFTKLATSDPVPGGTPPSVTVTPPAAPGGTLSATLANGPADPTDWVALYCPATAADGSYLDWKYLTDTTTPPGSGLAGATVHFTVPASATTCQVRWFGHNTFTPIASSGTITWPTLAATVANGTLTVTAANGPGNARDWVALYCPPTAGSYADWKYLSDSTTPPASGVTGATLHFPAPTTAATCEVRWYANDTFTLLATSAPVATSSPTITVPANAAPGSTLSVTLAGGPASAGDWAALYCPATQADGGYLDWKYMSDTHSMPGSGLADATVTFTAPAAPASCEVRWYSNNGFTRLAVSTTVTVQ